MLSNGLEIYLQKFLAPFMGDWPTQFFMRQLLYNVAEVCLPAICQNVVPLIGPLKFAGMRLEDFPPHLCRAVCHPVWKKGKISKEATSMESVPIMEVLYGGWTLVRESILSAFCFCKNIDIEFLGILALVNLVKNYVPLVLIIYSIVFKCNDYELYCKSLLRIWGIMR